LLGVLHDLSALARVQGSRLEFTHHLADFLLRFGHLHACPFKKWVVGEELPAVAQALHRGGNHMNHPTRLGTIPQ
jgi:hypothetical protein